MTNLLAYSLSNFAGINKKDFEMSQAYWHLKEYKKGEYYNQYRNVCKYLGFIAEGAFRSYIVHDRSGSEKNIFFYSQHQFVVTFKSFMNQVPCDYHTQCMSNSKVF
jgi:hypothetical protein